MTSEKEQLRKIWFYLLPSVSATQIRKYACADIASIIMDRKGFDDLLLHNQHPALSENKELIILFLKVIVGKYNESHRGYVKKDRMEARFKIIQSDIALIEACRDIVNESSSANKIVICHNAKPIAFTKANILLKKIAKTILEDLDTGLFYNNSRTEIISLRETRSVAQLLRDLIFGFEKFLLNEIRYSGSTDVFMEKLFPTTYLIKENIDIPEIKRTGLRNSSKNIQSVRR